MDDPSSLLQVPEKIDRTRKERRRASSASFIGTTVEFYDFLLYTSAATLVFPALFFADVTPVVGIVLSYLTLAAGYLARPAGALIFGYFGDRFGRKHVLVTTMAMMGIVSVAIGLLPSTQVIGVAAPLLLAALRVLQGIAMGGEFGGALLLSYGYANVRRRGLGAAIAMAGAPTGALLASLLFAQFARLPQDQFLAWGWRIPFLLSAILVVFGLYVRSRIRESPEFEALKAASQAKKRASPLRLLGRHWRRVVLSILVGIASLTMYVLASTYFVGVGVQSGYPQPSVILLLSIGFVLQIAGIPLTAALSDRIGRLRVLVIGNIITAVIVVPVLALINSGTFGLYAVGFLVGMTAILFSYGPLGAYLGEQFPTQLRYTGVSLTYQLIALVAGFGPIIVLELTSLLDGGWALVATFLIALALIALLALFLNRRGSQPAPAGAEVG